MVQYTILQETPNGCIPQESYLSRTDAEHELDSWRRLDPAGVYTLEESEYEDSDNDCSAYADGPLFYGRYVGEPFESLQPGVKVAVYALEAWERKRVDAGIDFKILIYESGEGFFYASSDELEVFSEDIFSSVERAY